ncbi:hypothetical protein ABTG24_19565, partial [Acinetobacter baumannii]
TMNKNKVATSPKTTQTANYLHASDLANAIKLIPDTNARIEVCLNWINKHAKNSKSDLREIALAEETLADLYFSISKNSDAVVAYGK